MEKKNFVLKREKIKEKRAHKRHKGMNRYLLMFLLMLPFLIAIAIFSTIVVKEAKNLKSLAAGNAVQETKPENIIGDGWYILRDNATDYQKELFAQLKEAIEGEGADDQAKASLVAKNYVADFYTWTNKSGQYDIGGMYYIYDGEFKNGDHYRNNVYLSARDGFYKYLSTYATQYGKENLIEVTNVDVTRCIKMSEPYEISEHKENRQDENGEWYDYREVETYEAYLVTCKWSYADTTKLNLSQFANTINLAIINNDGEFQIVEASENEIMPRKEADNNTDETEETETTETESVEY